MPLEMRPVYSSFVAEIGYDGETQEFHVKFANGRTAVYDGVPPEIAARVSASPSIGEALHAEVRGQYKHRYV